MSSDNYWLIRKDNYGKFVPVMGFDSDESEPFISLRHARYSTIESAVAAVQDEYTEYGVQIHPECHSSDTPLLLKGENGHYAACVVNYADFYSPEEVACNCETVEENWNTEIPAVDEDSTAVIINSSDYAWLTEFDDVDRDEFLKEVKEAASNSVESLVTTLNAWRKTAEVISNPAVREALLTREFLDDESFVEVKEPVSADK